MGWGWECTSSFFAGYKICSRRIPSTLCTHNLLLGSISSSNLSPYSEEENMLDLLGSGSTLGESITSRWKWWPKTLIFSAVKLLVFPTQLPLLSSHMFQTAILIWLPMYLATPWERSHWPDWSQLSLYLIYNIYNNNLAFWFVFLFLNIVTINHKHQSQSDLGLRRWSARLIRMGTEEH